ncbi:NAD-dependent epimerase/dehydratase family protein [Caenispirillum bisanense]|uniref:NAD-dependent epimerase/dehydratase family protein n=1 Tax=Caenispirillum bisanense TaxID=414052 RepID=UPI0031E105BC
METDGVETGRPRTVAVTGATGFVGTAVCRRLLADGWRVVALVRTAAPAAAQPSGVESRPLGDLTAVADFAPLLGDVQAVVHLAAKVHVMRPTTADAADFHRVNVEVTRRLAEGAARAGVGRLLFVSTIKVNGEATAPGRPFRADDPPAAADDYGRSKAAAEAALWQVAAAHPGLGVTVIRPPVVYGPGVKANIAALARLCDSPWPLPLGATGNARSLIAVDNLADAVAVALAAPQAAVEVYLVRDGEDVSTGELIRRLRRLQGRPARLLPVPPGVLATLLRLGGRGGLGDRLLGSLTVDDGPIRAELGWQPPLSLDQGLARLLGRGQNQDQPALS